jgi:signal transduction histidine kinase
MTPDQIKQIFEPFNTTKSRGLGLGMPYAQKIIQQHGGQIVVESQPGKGTEVRIELPASERS